MRSENTETGSEGDSISHHVTFGRRVTNYFSGMNRIRKTFFVGVVIVLVVAGGYKLFHMTHNSTSLTGLPEVRAAEAKVAKHYLLPTNETPAMATVTDSKKLTTPFLKQAKDGDEILIYQKNQIAIIYRPSIDRVVAVGPVTIDTPPNPSSNSGQGNTLPSVDGQ